MMLTRTILPFFLLMTISVFCYSQKWESGYYITNEKDTVYGEIRKSPYGSFENFNFRTKSDNGKQRISVNNCRFYKKGKEEFERVTIPEEITGTPGLSFLKVIENGNVSLYEGNFRFVACDCDPKGQIVKGYVLVNSKRQTMIIRKPLLFKINNTETFYSFLQYEAGQGNGKKRLRYSTVPAIVQKMNLSSLDN